MSDSIGQYEDVEEVEVSGAEDEVEIEEEEEEETPTEPEIVSPPLETPSKKPGKVKPSEEVKNMKMESPQTAPKKGSSALPVGKNPFPTFGTWTPASISEIEIQFPVLTGKNESTNSLTKANKPEARYWKAPIVFKYGNYTSETLRFENVHIPYHTGKNYGTDFIYLCLPGFVAPKFAEAGKSRRPTMVNEKSLQADPNRWWKIANGVAESFGVINKETKKFHKKSLETIFDGTSSGITATVVLSFLFKASTDELDNIKPTTAGTVSVMLERGYITDTDVNVQMPIRLNTKKKRADPSATTKDVADDSVMKRLAELGL